MKVVIFAAQGTVGAFYASIVGGALLDAERFMSPRCVPQTPSEYGVLVLFFSVLAALNITTAYVILKKAS